MVIDDAVSLLEYYQREKVVSENEASNVMSMLLEMSAYPQNFIINGGLDFSLLYGRHGYFLVWSLLEFVGDALAGRAHITNFTQDPRFTMNIVQDNEIVTLVMNLYLKTWMELRTIGMNAFPYQLKSTTTQGGFYERLPPDKVLFAAGL